MTSIAKVAAHCSDNKEVHVVVTRGDDVVETFVLQNGETKEVYVYDDRVVSTYEMLKEQPTV